MAGPWPYFFSCFLELALADEVRRVVGGDVGQLSVVIVGGGAGGEVLVSSLHSLLGDVVRPVHDGQLHLTVGYGLDLSLIHI